MNEGKESHQSNHKNKTFLITDWETCPLFSRDGLREIKKKTSRHMGRHTISRFLRLNLHSRNKNVIYTHGQHSHMDTFTVSGNFKDDWCVELSSLKGEWTCGEWQVNKHFPSLVKTPVTMKSVLTITTWIHSACSLKQLSPPPVSSKCLQLHNCEFREHHIHIHQFQISRNGHFHLQQVANTSANT